MFADYCTCTLYWKLVYLLHVSDNLRLRCAPSARVLTTMPPDRHGTPLTILVQHTVVMPLVLHWRRQGLTESTRPEYRFVPESRIRSLDFSPGVLSASELLSNSYLGLPPDADENGNYAFFDAANYALIQMTGGVTATPVV